MNYNENEKEIKKQKRMLIIIPLLMVFVIAGVIVSAYFVTLIAEEINIVLPENLSIIKFSDNNWSEPISTRVRNDSGKKKIIKCLNRLDLEPLDNKPEGNYFGGGSSYVINLEFENDEDGSIQTKTYNITGDYVIIDGIEWNSISEKQTEELKDILEDALENSRGYNNDIHIYR
jgi:hypothetical protein